MPYVNIDASDFDDDELIEELEDRGYMINSSGSSDIESALMEIYLQRRLGLPYDHLVDKLIYEVLGKVI